MLPGPELISPAEGLTRAVRLTVPRCSPFLPPPSDPESERMCLLASFGFQALSHRPLKSLRDPRPTRPSEPIPSQTREIALFFFALITLIISFRLISLSYRPTRIPVRPVNSGHPSDPMTEPPAETAVLQTIALGPSNRLTTNTATDPFPGRINAVLSLYQMY